MTSPFQNTALMTLKRSSILLGTSALTCVALSGAVMAETFDITSDDGTTNGQFTDTEIDGSDTVTLGVALDTVAIADEGGIETTGGTNAIEVTADGSITTGGDNAKGIFNFGDTNETTLSGSITTAGGDAYGIRNNGNSNKTVMEEGSTITTTGLGAIAIRNTVGNNTTTMSGSIASYGENASGIQNVGGDNTTTLSGSITTDGVEAYGIRNSGNSNTTTMEAGSTIATTGLDAYGIKNTGDGNKNAVSGSITTGGTSAVGIYNGGTGNTITTLSGSITTGGTNAIGIYNNSDTNTTTLSGNITTAGSYAYGISNNGTGNTATLSGSIMTTGEGADGIINWGGANATILSTSGSIATKGVGGRGIWNDGDTNETTMSGSITTSGNYGYGIMNDGDTNTTTMSGSITTAGYEAYGIWNEGTGNTTNISGTVKATGVSSAALYNSSGSGNSFTLNEGATIIGDVLANDSSTNSKLVFNLGAATSYAYSVSGLGEGTGAGQWTYSDQDGRSQAVTTNGTGCDTTIGANNDTCNLVTGAGIGNAEVQNELQYITNNALIGSLQFGSTVATSENVAASQGMWAQAYGSNSELVTTTAIAFDARDRGLTIGTPVVGSSLNLDVVFNTSSTDLNIGTTGDQNIIAKGVNLGAVMTDLAPASGWDVSAFGFVGKNAYDGTRKVMNNQEAIGSETVTSSYSGTEVLVGFNANTVKPMDNGLSFIGNVNASLSNESIGAYSESKYFAWDARTMTQVSGGASVGLTYTRDALTTFATLGADYSSLTRGETASYTNQSAAATHTDSGVSDIYRTVSVGFNYESSNGASFVGAINASSSDNGLTSTAANLGVNWTF